MNCIENSSLKAGTSPSSIPSNTYGMTSHRVLLNPCINMSARAVLNNTHFDTCTDAFGRPRLGEDPLLVSQMSRVSGQIGSFGSQQCQSSFTPGKFQTILGHTYSPACKRTSAHFNTEQERDRLFSKDLQALDWFRCTKPKPWESSQFLRSAGNGLLEYAPSGCCQQSNLLSSQGQGPSSGSGTGTGGCEGGDRGKKQGQFSCCSCEKNLSFQILSRDRPSCDYGDRRMWGIATDQVLNRPVGDIIPVKNSFFVSRPPIDRVQQIYRGCEGLTPDYAGHVPGEQFRIGRTFPASTRNAKRAIDPVSHVPLCYPPIFKK